MFGDVHVIAITAPASVLYDPAGRQPTVIGETITVDDARIQGGSQREIDQFAQRGVILDAIADIPHDTEFSSGSPVTIACQVQCDDDEIHPALRGLFNIAEVRPNFSHIRLMLTRSQR